MKRYLLAISLLVSSNNTLAVMGVGDVVTDPGAYSYFAKELEQGFEALQTAVETKDLTLQMVKNFEGSLLRAQRAVKQVQNYKERLTDDPWNTAEDIIRDPESYEKDLERLYKNIDRSAYPTQQSYEDWKAFVESQNQGESLNLPDTPDWITVRNTQKRLQNKDLSDAIKRSQKADSMIQLQLDDLEELGNLVNGAQSQKDATDVQSAILLKMATDQQEIISLLSSINKTLASTQLNQLGKNQADSNALQKIQSLSSDSAKSKRSLSGQSKPSQEDTLQLFGGGNPFK